MLKTDNSPITTSLIPNFLIASSPTTSSPISNTQIQIHKDKMKLTVINIYPSFQKKSKQEIQQEIETRLYQIFKKYA